MRDTGLVLFSSSWGEVDWILPVLVKIKELEPNIKLGAVFRHHGLLSHRDRNIGLASQLDKVIDSYILGPPLDMDPSRIRFVLKDYSEDDSFKNKVCSECKGAKIVVYPHGNAIGIDQQVNAPNMEIWRTHAPSHDVMLLGTKYDIKWWGKRVPNPNFKVIGFPRYDDWWIRTLTTDQEFLDSKEHEVAIKYNVVMFVTRAPHREYLPSSIHDYLVSSTAEVVLKDPNNFLIIKPHPKQNLGVVQRLLAGYDRWMFSKFQALQIASLSDITVSMFSSCILDSLATGTPVIEFFQYPSANEEYVYLKNGQLGSTYSYLGLTLPVNTKEEFETAFYNNNDGVYKREGENFSSLMIENATEKAALEILGG